MRHAKVRDSLRILRELKVPIQSIIDVGIQHSTPPLMEAFPDIHHFLFEPVEEYYPFIKDNYKSFDYTLVEAAVSDTNSTLSLKTQKKTRGDEISHAYLTKEVSQDTRLVPVIKLDDFFSSRQDSNNFLFKIDVDGPDVPAAILRGAREVLKKSSVVMIEMTVDRFAERADVLHEAGFDIWDVCDLCYYGNCLWQFDAFFVKRELKDAIPLLRPMSSQPFSKELWQSGF
jgi:FkbM family methyltransferase